MKSLTRKSAGICYLLFLFFSSCHYIDKDTKAESTNPPNVGLSQQDTSMSIDDTLSFNEHIVFDEYFSELVDSIKQNRVPVFMYDECLDAKELAYCDLGSHKSRSLRYDLLWQLSNKELEALALLADPSKLKKVCHTDFLKEKSYGRVSNYDLIKQIKKEKASPKRL